MHSLAHSNNAIVYKMKKTLQYSGCAAQVLNLWIWWGNSGFVVRFLQFKKDVILLWADTAYGVEILLGQWECEGGMFKAIHLIHLEFNDYRLVERRCFVIPGPEPWFIFYRETPNSEASPMNFCKHIGMQVHLTGRCYGWTNWVWPAWKLDTVCLWNVFDTVCLWKHDSIPGLQI